MKVLLALAGVAVALTAGGCASNGWRAEEVPLPRSTPYDANEFSRNIFLEGFREGYRAEMQGSTVLIDSLGGPHPDARRRGYHAGVTQAQADKAKESGR